jgi:hypothetical protein
MCLACFFGCSGDTDDDSTAGDDDIVGDDDDATAGDDDDTTGSDDDDDDTAATVPALTVVADITWSLDFDADAEAEGYVDCAYTRAYEGVQFLDQPYLCAGCTIQLAGTATMTEGFASCYEPIFGGVEARPEFWGFGWPDVDGGAAPFFRSAAENMYTTSPLATVDSVSLDTSFELGWDSEYTLADLGIEAEGVMGLAAAGTAVVSEDPGTQLTDPYVPRAEPYACGWPTDNPGSLDTDWVLALDATLPTAALEDECGELVNLWDLYGRYLVIDSTQPDCGYCLLMAEDAPGFLDEMDGLGIPTEFVSLLGEGLNNVIGEPTQAAFDSYLSSYGHGGPLLKDRGYGYAMFKPYWDDQGEDLGYPTWAIVRPDMTLLHVGKGFSDFEEIRGLIVEDAS